MKEIIQFVKCLCGIHSFISAPGTHINCIVKYCEGCGKLHIEQDKKCR